MNNRFDWQSLLAAATYKTYPEAQHKPVIGITGNYGDQVAKLSEGYYKSIVRAGGIPVIIPPVSDPSVIINTLEHIDGLLLSGGADYNPLYAGEEPSPKLGGINSERDLPELLITQLAYNRHIPMLGICRGIQTLAMALGGRVAQDIIEVSGERLEVSGESLEVSGESLEVSGERLEVSGVKHSQDADRGEATHSVMLEPDSILARIYQSADTIDTSPSTNTIYVNSFHHQAVAETGSRFRVTGRAQDGVIEAIESTEFRSILGVQWHPECLPAEDGSPVFSWLVREAMSYRQACEAHGRILSLDTHCDTPMLFPHGVDFGSRDERILVDLHKMHEGRQDATIMVCYLPQPQDGESFREKVKFDVAGPKEYADLIFDKIEDIVARNRQHLALACTPGDLLTNKQAGKKSIMLGIENGLALDGNIKNLKHFAESGIVYITLCHNGDNDICDSARGNATHGGVSTFGRDVIREMNRLGIMVDLSHAAESSFYDALDISATPIVCSHSSCRALCDHPRNLTDDQMRALAKKGGVMQVTLYHGFLVKDGEATVNDALRHLEHAIEVMGIDHVGIGTDFDGDGGVRGFADASYFLDFTRRLLACGYSDSDIEKILGGNFLRVMDIVQRYV